MEEIEKKFLEAVEEVSNSTWGDKVPDKRKLLIYAYYKQATIGDINTEQPWAYQVKARAKWDAWNSVKGMSKYDAMQNYINLISESDQNWEKHDGLKNMILFAMGIILHWVGKVLVQELKEKEVQFILMPKQLSVTI